MNWFTKENIYIALQAIITLTFLFTVVVMSFQGREIPDLLGNSTALVVGFFFGQQVESRLLGYLK